jgi:hypothetical protein
MYCDTLSCVKYEDALKGLNELETWLKVINTSAVESLVELKEELLILHKLEVS